MLMLSRLGHRHSEKKEFMKSQGEDGPKQTKEGGLRRNHADIPHLRLTAAEMQANQFLLSKPVSV